jgi:hypothetical protein
MPAISACPRCQKLVCLPSDVESAAQVRCPHCHAEYALGEAVPPELIPVLAVTTDGAELAADEPPADEENEAAAGAERVPIAAVLGRGRKSKRWWQTPLEIITGGLAGCLVAYYGLALWFGPEFKNALPEFPLPGITWLTTPPAKDNDEAKKAAAKPVKPNPTDDHSAAASEATKPAEEPLPKDAVPKTRP